jgi:hypothetical protein
VLSIVLAGCLLLVAAPASVPVLAFAALSAVLLAVAPWVAGPRPLAAVLLLAGTVPIAVVLWWTVVVPLIAALGLLAGLLARRPW